VAPSAFTGPQLGQPAGPAPRLRTLLVTGDSMSQPLDADLARALADKGVRTVRDAHLGTAISKPLLADWRELSAQQEQAQRPDAVVMFLGANEGFPLQVGRRTVACCGPAWAAEYATRARTMIANYLDGGAHRLYWILIPAPRDPARARIATTVNAAIRVAAAAFGAQAVVVDDTRIFTPKGFRNAMRVDGRQQIVRQPDGIHLNDLGAQVLGRTMLGQLARSFAIGR
jgi:hypothetical protein